MKKLLLTIFLITSTFLAACSIADSGVEKDRNPAKELEAYELGTVEKSHRFGDIFLASQPQPEDFKRAKNMGVTTVVNLRPESEMSFDEKIAIAELEMNYVNVPFGSPAELTDDVFKQTRELLKNQNKRPLLMHCSSANRVGAVWLAHRVLDDGLSFEDALAEAKMVGLTLPALEQRAQQYIKSQTN